MRRIGRAARLVRGAMSRLPTARRLLAQAHRRLTMFAVLLTAASLMVSGCLTVRDYAQRNLALSAQNAAHVIEQDAARGDQRAVRQDIAAFAAREDVLWVEVRDAAGRQVEQWRSQSTILPGAVLDRIGRALGTVPASATLWRGDAAIGEVRISGNPENLLRFAFAGLIIAGCTLLLSAVATRLLTGHLQRDVVSPLEHVAELAHVVRTRRAFDRRVPQSGIAEIERFGRDFNALLAELQGWHAAAAGDDAAVATRVLFDPQTGLGNRAAFEVALNDAVSSAVALGRSFTVLYCNIADFESLRGEPGDDAADLALARVAGRLRTTLRQDDQAFRLDGNQFALLPGAAGPAALRAIAARLDEAMAAPLALGDGLVRAVSLNIGIAAYPDDGWSPQELLDRTGSPPGTAILTDTSA